MQPVIWQEHQSEAPQMSLPTATRQIQTELHAARLTLRCPRKGDGQALHEAVIESLDQLRAWPASLPWAMQEPSVAVSEAYCVDSAAAFMRRSSLVYLAFGAEGNFVGSISLHGINWNVPKFEIGFWCRSGLTGKGYMKEAITALMGYAFESLDAQRVEAFPDEENTGSRAACQSAGMSLEGVLKNERITPQGRLRNTCVYASVRNMADAPR